MVKVLNTRPTGQNQELTKLLLEGGFEPIEIPLVDIIPLEDGLRKVLRLQPSGYTGIFLSSPNGIRQMQAGLDEDFEAWIHKPFFMVGGKSQKFIESLGGTVAFFPKEASVAGFLKEFPFENISTTGPKGMIFAQRWLHPCSLSSSLDPIDFKKCGVELDNVPVYKPTIPADTAEKLLVEFPKASAILFCSGSAVAHFFQAVPEFAEELILKKGKLVISIGPSTSSALRERGVTALHQAEEANSRGLVETLRKQWAITENIQPNENIEGKI